MLERKRILVERSLSTAPDGTLVHVYEHRRSGDVMLIADPRLTDGQVPEVQAEIERLLGLRQSAPPEPTAEPPPPPEPTAEPPAADGLANPRATS